MYNEIKGFYEFGGFRLDAGTKTLYRDGEAVALKPKAVEMLVVLVENAGAVVSKDDLLKAVWRDVFVEENNLSVNIYELRRAFARYDSENKFIQTVPRRGFRFVGEVKKFRDTKYGERNFNGNDRSLYERYLPVKPDESLTAGKVEETSESAKASNEETARQENSTRRRNFFAVIAAGAVLIFAAGIFLFYRRTETPKAFERATEKQAVETQKKRPTENLEAFQIYERGHQLWQTRVDADMEKGKEYFRRAVALDPNFVLPYIGLADSLSMMNDDPNEWREARANVEKALALAPDSAEAHASLAFIEMMNEWHWREAETEFKRAIELDANCAKAHQWYALLLMLERRLDEAENELRQAIRIEPASPNYSRDLCELYAYSKSFEQAAAFCRFVNDVMPPKSYTVNLSDIFINIKLHDPNFSLNTSEEEKLFSAEDLPIYRKDGAAGVIKARLNFLKEHPRSGKTLDWFVLASSYAMLGEKEKALEYLEKAYSAHTFMLPFANVKPNFNSLRTDARFQDLMRRVGLK